MKMPFRVELEQHVLLRRQCLRRPAPLLLVARDAARRCTRCASDGARITTIMRWPSATGERARRRRAPASSRPRSQGAVASKPGRPTATTAAATTAPASRTRGGREATQPHARRGRGRQAAASGSTKRAAEAIIAALSVHSSSGASVASGSEARSSEFAATPPTTAIRSCAELPGRQARAIDEGADDRALVARGQVGAARLELVGRQPADRVEQRSLHAGEGEVETLETRDRKVERLRVAVRGQPVERGAARVAETEQACALVERLAGGVVDRRPHRAVATAVADVEEQRMAAGREQAEERRLERFRLEVERRDVPVQVVDRCERQASPPRQRLGRGERRRAVRRSARGRP